MIRRTKIVCTIGPATASEDQLRRLIGAGMDVARLNFSHGDAESHTRTIRLIRRLSAVMCRTVGILQDLAGPKIRLGELPGGDRLLEVGREVILAPVGSGRDEAEVIGVNYPDLVEDVVVGDRILLSDGLVELEVKGVDGGGLRCRVTAGGVIGSHKGVNLPVSNLRVETFTAKDRADLTVGLVEGVDFVALSFVRHENDLAPVREIINQDSRPPLLIAKIETPQAVGRLEQILAHVDGVMVARGDLGVEMPFEEVPVIQKRIIDLARRAAKPVITATQMLRSMIDSPRPTRAEATDVANAVLDGTDALMLSDETAVGAYSVEAVEVLDRIARATEPSLDGRRFLQEPASDVVPSSEAAISRAACGLAYDLGAAAIVASTSSGATPRLVARLRPHCPVVGLTDEPLTERQLSLSWGVVPMLVGRIENTDRMFGDAARLVRERHLAGVGDRVIVTAGMPHGVPGTTNLLKVIDLKD